MAFLIIKGVVLRNGLIIGTGAGIFHGGLKKHRSMQQLQQVENPVKPSESGLEKKIYNYSENATERQLMTFAHPIWNQ